MTLATISGICSPQLLMSVIVHVRDRKNDLIRARALLDTCATTNFISESLVKRLGLRVVKHSIHRRN